VALILTLKSSMFKTTFSERGPTWTPPLSMPGLAAGPVYHRGCGRWGTLPCRCALGGSSSAVCNPRRLQGQPQKMDRGCLLKRRHTLFKQRAHTPSADLLLTCVAALLEQERRVEEAIADGAAHCGVQEAPELSIHREVSGIGCGKALHWFGLCSTMARQTCRNAHKCRPLEFWQYQWQGKRNNSPSVGLV
jgi:hypothetical protein